MHCRNPFPLPDLLDAKLEPVVTLWENLKRGGNGMPFGGWPCGQEARIDLRQTEPNPRSLVRFIENCGREHDMSGLKWLMIAGLIAGFAGAAQAEDFDIGKSEFQSSCASCHGTDAKGKGPVSDQLKIPPPDLTMLAKNNNGVFPTNAVYETINGLKTIPAHGTREMPIWGYRFNPAINLPHNVDLPYQIFGPNPEVVVRTRILAVIDYLSRIQQK
jgi:cytochrome c5